MKPTVCDLETSREKSNWRPVYKVVDGGTNAIALEYKAPMNLNREADKALRDRGHEVPVVDPAGMALKVAEALVDLNPRHSKRTYPYPPEKEIVGYAL